MVVDVGRKGLSTDGSQIDVDANVSRQSAAEADCQLLQRWPETLHVVEHHRASIQKPFVTLSYPKLLRSILITSLLGSVRRCQDHRIAGFRKAGLQPAVDIS